MLRKHIDRQITIWQDWLLTTYSFLELTAQLFGGRRSSSSSWARDNDNLVRHVRDHYHIYEEIDTKQTESLPLAKAWDDFLEIMWH